MNSPNRVLTPRASNKRKESERFDALKPSPTKKIPKPAIPKAGLPATPEKGSEPAHRNWLLAGYLAHEFLTKGTILGQRWDPARAEAVPLSAASSATQSKKLKPTENLKAEQSQKAELKVEHYKRYVEIASLLKTDGAHIPGVINPTQLAGFFRL